MNNFKISLFFVFIFLLCLSCPVAAEEDSSTNRLAKGALVGAGTNVIGGAALDSLDGSNQPQYTQVQGPDGQMYWQQAAPQEDPNKTILKRAVQGAITGAVAAEVAKDDSGKGSGEKESGGWFDSLKNMFSKKSEEPKSEEPAPNVQQVNKKSEGWRPPGWDRGKKTGWGDGDIPPGLRKKDSDHDDDSDDDDEDEDDDNGRGKGHGHGHGKKH